MLSGVLILDLKGEIVLQRFYRDDIPPSAEEAFRLEVIASRKSSLPVVNIDDCSFMYMRHNNIYVATVTRHNANPMLGFQFLQSLVEVLTAYFGEALTDEVLRNNFVLTYELLDDMMDFGYPQLTTPNLLKNVIRFVVSCVVFAPPSSHTRCVLSSAQVAASLSPSPPPLTLQCGALHMSLPSPPPASSLGSIKGSSSTGPQAGQADKITSFITGAVDWREPNKHVYKKNEVYLDILEAVNVLMAADGTVLRADVSGKLVMKTYLTGMPDCKLGLNDRVLADKGASSARRGGGAQQAIAIDDINFHRCVHLTQFDADRTISFIPPDGTFTLMKYRVTQNVVLPLTVTPTIVVRGRTRIEYEITVKGNFDSHLNATDVKLVIPVPPNVASASCSASAGKAKLKPMLTALQWKIPRIAGNASHTLRAEVMLLASVEDKPWVRPPLNVDFQVPMFTSSGLAVRYLQIVERSHYETIKWVRSLTRAGAYSIRI